MFRASMAETSRNVEHLQNPGTEISYLQLFRWVCDAPWCQIFLMLRLATSFDHLSLGLYDFNHEQRSAGDPQ